MLSRSRENLIGNFIGKRTSVFALACCMYVLDVSRCVLFCFFVSVAVCGDLLAWLYTIFSFVSFSPISFPCFLVTLLRCWENWLSADGIQ